MSILSRAFQVRPGEGRMVALVVGLMFLAVAALTVGESGISALFLDRVGPQELPTMYVLQAVVGILAMLVLSAVLGRFERRRAYVALPLAMAGAVSVEGALLSADLPGVYHALYLTIPLAYLTQAVFLWGTAGLVTDTRRAKRLFPLFGAGSILGAVAGGLATQPLASAIGSENLLLVWIAGLVGSALLCATILGVRRGTRRPAPKRRRPSALAELAAGLRFVRTSRLLLWMSVASVLFSLLFYSLYQPYAVAATERFPDPDQLAGFFGVFWAGVTAAAFVVSIALTNRLLGWFGAATMIIVLPVLYLGAFGTLLATSAFATLVAIRFGVNVWLQGVSSPSWETLTNVAPEERRDQSRAFLNGGPSQVGTAIAGVILLVGGDALTTRQLATVGLVSAVVTLGVTWRMRRSYTGALVDAIRAGRPRVFEDAVPNAPIALRPDREAIALAIHALDEPEPRLRRLACDLLASAEDRRATRALATALGDTDGLVRARAVEALGARGALGGAERSRALEDEEPQVRLAAVRSLGTGEVPLATIADVVPSVAAAAAARSFDAPGAASRFEALLSDDDAEARAFAVRELRAAPPDRAVAFAWPLLDDPSPVVHGAALEVLADAGAPEARDAAVRALASEHPTVREAGLRALDRLQPAAAREEISAVFETAKALAQRDGRLSASIATDASGAAILLRDALLARARERAIVALSASTVLSVDPDAMRVAIEVLAERANAELANALETIEAAAPFGVRSLVRLWEPPSGPTRTDEDAIAAALADEDPFIRACAELAASADRPGRDEMTHAQRSLSPVELVLVLRGIPLFATLEPAELLQVAAIAEERSYEEGDLLGAEGELGDEMHVLLEGSVRVLRADGTEIARRAAGDVVGEVSLITSGPRIASLVADGEVRTVRIGGREFASMVRERPGIALAVMRVLAQRLGEATVDPVDRACMSVRPPTKARA